MVSKKHWQHTHPSKQCNVGKVESNNIEAAVKLITTSSDDPEVVVHSMSSVTIIPAGKLVNIQCKVNLGNTTSKVPMLFQTEEIELPEGLKTFSTIVSVKSDPNHQNTSFKQLKA